VQPIRERGGWGRNLAGILGLIAFGTLVALGPAELLLRLRARGTPYRVLPANVRAEFHPATEVMPGIEGTSVYSTNADGIRGRRYRPGGRLNLLAVGGSTTECLYLDDGEAWPALLEEKLTAALDRDVWVGNVGVSGFGAAEHVLAARHYVPQLRLDAVLVLLGLNDLLPVLRKGDRYRPESEDPDDYRYFLDRSFHQRPLVDPEIQRPFPDNLALWNLGRRGYWRLRRWWKSQLEDGALLVEDVDGEAYTRRRELRAGLPPVDGLPDLGPGLERFERNLAEMIARIRATGARPVLITQPMVWHAGISPEAERLLWSAFLGDNDSPEGRYRVADLERAMATFNDATLEACRRADLPCVDLASAMARPERESWYYDDAHYNERGAEVVARILARALAPLWSGGRDLRETEDQALHRVRREPRQVVRQ
jgi:lysophospholipase L1-like esterase